MLDCGMHMGYNDSVSIMSTCVILIVGIFRDAFQTSHLSQSLVD